jgi:hypothetical protein
MVNIVPLLNSLLFAFQSESGSVALDRMVLSFGMVLFGILVSGAVADRQADITSRLTAQISALVSE